MCIKVYTIYLKHVVPGHTTHPHPRQVVYSSDHQLSIKELVQKSLHFS